MAEHTTGEENSNGTASSNGHAATNGHAPDHGNRFDMHAVENAADGFFEVLGRQWHVIVLSLILTLLGAVLYLLLAKPTYTAMSRLRVQSIDPQAITSGNNNGSNNNEQSTPDFLDTECVVIKSNAVLALAMQDLGDTKSLAGMPHPINYLKSKLVVGVSKQAGRAIEVSIDSKNRDDAVQIVKAVVDAYGKYNSNYWQNRNRDFLKVLTQGSHDEEAQIQAKTDEMMKVAKKNGYKPGLDPQKNPVHQQVVSLLDARMKAYLDSISAKDAYDQAAKSVTGDPAKLAAVDELLQHSLPVADPADKLHTIQQELSLQEAQLIDLQQHFGKNYPRVQDAQSRVDQTTVESVVAAKEWADSSQTRLESLDKKLAEAQQIETDQAQNEMIYRRLEDDVARLRKQGDEVDNRIRTIEVTKNSTALTIDVLDPAEVSPDVKPLRGQTLAIAAVLGLIGGLGLACLRDWTDDRLRTQAALRSAVNAPVLGAVPAITTAYTAADRGQIVHHDPFGEAAESYRTLRTALQYSLPQGTKTLLITSPVAGDGKSTLVSNLAIALAQASKHVLIVDCDFRAPVQHRLFGLKDRIGFATVLDNGDRLEQAIQRTEIEGLDVLPAGPAPSNPAELLNDPALADHLNELADKYDLILIDSPPITAVADARILAATADASLLVVRPQTSARKQIEAARDGLRSVGARLVGVAVNGLTGRHDFGASTGYYPRSDVRPKRTNRLPAETPGDGT